MAIVQNPALSLDASGNVGGICYLRWKSLNVARGAWTGVVPNTSKQVTHQGMMRTVSQAWGLVLSQSQRAAWEKFARNEVYTTRLSIKYKPTGYLCYARRNLIRAQAGLSVLADPPVQDEAMYARYLNTYVNPANTNMIMRLTLNEGFGGAVAICDRIEYWISRPFVSEGRHATDPDFRVVGYQLPTVTQNYSGVVSPAYYWIRARMRRDTGIVGNWFEKQQFRPVPV